jgi:hypothetical protein
MQVCKLLFASRGIVAAALRSKKGVERPAGLSLARRGDLMSMLSFVVVGRPQELLHRVGRDTQRAGLAEPDGLELAALNGPIDRSNVHAKTCGDFGWNQHFAFDHICLHPAILLAESAESANLQRYSRGAEGRRAHASDPERGRARVDRGEGDRALARAVLCGLDAGRAPGRAALAVPGCRPTRARTGRRERDHSVTTLERARRTAKSPKSKSPAIAGLS